MSNQIKPNDLRIGNYVFYDGRCFQIEGLTKDYPFLNTIEFGDNVVTYEKLRPVRLTIEIALKCGFLRFLIDAAILFIEGYGSLKLINGVLFLSTMETPIKYLHQLQNYIYALTQKELEIKF